MRRLLLISLPILLFGSIIQFENSYALQGSEQPFQLIDFLLKQLPFLLIALLLAAVGIICATRRLARHAYSALLLGYLLLLTFDQLSFSLYGGHLRSAMMWQQTDLEHLQSSLLAVLGPIPLLNLALSLTTVWIVNRLLTSQPLAQLGNSARGNPLLVATSTLILLIAYAFVAPAIAPGDPYKHPLLMLAGDLSPKHTAQPKYRRVEDIYRLRHGKPMPHQPPEIPLSKERPNVVLLVLESVGTAQLFDSGRFGPQSTPNLHALVEDGLLFDHIYANLPGSENAKLNMLSGGYSPTWQDLAGLTQYPFQGPLLNRILERAGYETAIHASVDLNYRNFRPFFELAGYQQIIDYGSLPAEEKSRIRLNSWGGQDHLVIANSIDWLARRERQQPFFLHYLSNTPHHPFDVPEEHALPPAISAAKDPYLAALHYIDSAIGQLVDWLKKERLYDNTIIVVTGDHGEPLADPQAAQARSRNYLYEAAVRDFLIIKPAGKAGLGQRFGVRGTHGDLLPTLLELMGMTTTGTLGQDLLDPTYQERIIYFNNSNQPGEWGLLDGGWKFMASGISGGSELYDLAQDPNETHNLAQAFPDRVKLYNELCANWFLSHNRLFIDQLAGYEAADAGRLDLDILASRGVYELVIGQLHSDQGTPVFTASSRLHPKQQVAVRTEWLPYDKKSEILYQWRSPTGVVEQTKVPVMRKSLIPVLALHAPRPLETGQWELLVKEDDKLLARRQFEISHQAALPTQGQPPYKMLLGMRPVHFQGDNYQPQTSFSANQQVGIQIRWRDAFIQLPHQLNFELPDGRHFAQPLPPRLPGQINQVIPLSLSPTAPRGRWRVYITLDKQVLGETVLQLGASQ